ncbi:MAG: hypothetical protein HY023_09375 [Chloroflexi bacterium]|nr:hypothetical protein [Chloroflexota bacterium]
MQNVFVRLDDRARTLGAILALTDWPDREQREKAYQPHRVAVKVREALHLSAAHPSVSAFQRMLTDGKNVQQLYQAALLPDPEIESHLIHFATDARLADFWAETDADWTEAETDARAVFQRSDLLAFLIRLFGALARQPAFIPNLLYPGRQTLTVGPFGNEVVALVPPPQAWGASQPWRYAERPDEALATACVAYCQFIFDEIVLAHPEPLSSVAALHRARELFSLAATGLFLHDADGAAASGSFLLLERKTRKLDALPAAIRVLEQRLGDRPGLPLDYLPLWAADL